MSGVASAINSNTLSSSTSSQVQPQQDHNANTLVDDYVEKEGETSITSNERKHKLRSDVWIDFAKIDVEREKDGVMKVKVFAIFNHCKNRFNGHSSTSPLTFLTMTDSQELLNPKHLTTIRRRINPSSSSKIYTVGVNGIENDPMVILDSSDEDRTNLISNNQESLRNTDSSYSLISNGEEEDESGGFGRERSSKFADKYMYRASSPTHRRVKESPLSSDAIFRQSHDGLFNPCIVVHVGVNDRLIIENLMKLLTMLLATM